MKYPILLAAILPLLLAQTMAMDPTESPLSEASASPSANPSERSSLLPSDTPSLVPSDKPSISPSQVASSTPPSFQPSDKPNHEPSSLPSTYPPTPLYNTSDTQTVGLEPDLGSYGEDPLLENYPLGLCAGDCDQNLDCQLGLVCHPRNASEPVPGCSASGPWYNSSIDFCIEPLPNSLIHYGIIPEDRLPLRPCQGDCNTHNDCGNGLYCFQKHPFQSVPGCTDGDMDATQTGFCVEAPPGKLIDYSGNPRPYHFPLGECEGDCDKDSDCADGLVCHQRDVNQTVPGCFGGEKEVTRTDFCVVALPTAPPYFLPTPPDGIVTYHPGNLTTFKDRLLLSEGLDSKLLATSEKTVKFKNGSESTIDFHGRPDAGATFPDTRAHNVGGWVYVSNSEMQVNGTGGVGAITFDKDGSMIDYQMVLEGSTWNCGGGKTPWNTWVSCEELPGGKIFQVDPLGVNPAEEMTLGSSEGRWESFAYDIRNPNVPRFYATEDAVTGALERFTPTNPNWNNAWDILHGPGSLDYLMLQPSQVGSSNGTFVWTTNRASAKQNARQNYPHSEGIDVYENQLFFVCKQIRKLFVLDLDAHTYTRSSTESGLFDGGPDQLKRIINDEAGLLYFTEDGGVDSGIHARDTQGRFYTILESPILPGEAAGLAFSPDGKFMYMAYQDVGMLYAIWRRDGFPFHATHLDVKYHQGT